jgi:hypothetical protein
MNAAWNFLCLLALPALMGCAKDSVPVSIHGVNYTRQEFSFTIVDPADKKNFGGREAIAPFSAGGTMCCYSLPTKWRAGIKVQIDGTHWLPEKPDGSLPEVKEKNVVEVPLYVNGKPGELWVLRGADGDLSVISSDFQPDHAKWPGKVKGWPVPSLEYQRERLNLYIKLEQDILDTFENSLSQLTMFPDAKAKKAWANAVKRDPESIQPYKGPDDKAYREYLDKEYREGIATSRKKLQRLKAQLP